MLSWLLKPLQKAYQISSERSESPDDEPGNDETYQVTTLEPVYLVTIDLERSVRSYNQTPLWLRFTFPRDTKLVKHWGILVRNTVYELTRDRSVSNSGVKLNTLDWHRVQDSFDPPIKVGETSLSDEAILAIANARFSNWPKDGYSVTLSNCQCFCYRFSWYICDETRSRQGMLESNHIPTRVAIVQAYMFCMVTVSMSVGWAVWMKKLWWPLGWDTLVGVIYEAGLFFMLRIFLHDRESLGGWNGSERMVPVSLPKMSAHVVGLDLSFNFALGLLNQNRFMKQVWLSLHQEHIGLGQEQVGDSAPS